MIYKKWIKEWKSALAENFFLRVLCLVLAVGLTCDVLFFRKKDRIVVIPPRVEREFWVDEKGASESYIEQMAVFFATLIGNMSPLNADYNTQVIGRYIDHKSYPTVKTELASQALYFRKNNITQSFFPEGTRINIPEGTAEVVGTVIRYVGSVKISQEKMVVRMKIGVDKYTVKLEELYTDYPDRKKAQEVSTEAKR
ncbi:MAG: type IV conjugative transfer system protein TraE [Candidatus Methanosuratincola sp.]